MKALRQALQTFWSQLGLPVRAAGPLPPGAKLPCIVWDMVSAGLPDVLDVTATCWFRENHGACADMLSRMRALLPEGGLLLRFPGGMAVCFRGASERAEDRQDARLCGATLHMEVHLYAEEEFDEC